MTPAAGGVGDRAAAITLALDASTYTGTVAVFRGRTCVAQREALMRGEDEERLMPAVVAALGDADGAVRHVTRIVCGAGPGSFTSLRIAAAIAKGIAVGNAAVQDDPVPLYAVSSLALIVAGVLPALAPGRYLALLDAMRMERYAALYEVRANGAVHELDRLDRVREDDIVACAAKLGAEPIGPRESRVAAPHARGLAALFDDVLVAEPVSIDTWEPAYGRLAEAQVRWEATHGKPLPSA